MSAPNSTNPPSYPSVYRPGKAEITVKKSRFLSEIRHVTSTAEAEAFLDEVRHTYPDASHHCYAYTVGARGEIVRKSDDGEPSQTAGKPILDVLAGAGIRDAAIVVTRYFGGTLLGTGGLVRAYQEAAAAALAGCVTVCKRYGQVLLVTTDYGSSGKLRYLFEHANIPIPDIRYTESVTYTILVDAVCADALKEQIAEATNGSARITLQEERYYAILGGKAVTDV